MYDDDIFTTPSRRLGHSGAHIVRLMRVLSLLITKRICHHQLPFGLFILFLTFYGALSKPRTEEERLTRLLHRDGALFFLVRLN